MFALDELNSVVEVGGVMANYFNRLQVDGHINHLSTGFMTRH